MGAPVLHDDFHIDIPARLRMMRDNAAECAIGREAFLAQVITWALVGGVDPTTIERTFYPDKLCMMGAQLSQPIDAVFAREVVAEALFLLPERCVMRIVRETRKREEGAGEAEPASQTSDPALPDRKE